MMIYDLQILFILTCVFMFICLYLFYEFFEKKYFYNDSNLPFVCKFIYGNYLQIISVIFVFIQFCWIFYMEYMSLDRYVNPDKQVKIVDLSTFDDIIFHEKN